MVGGGTAAAPAVAVGATVAYIANRAAKAAARTYYSVAKGSGSSSSGAPRTSTIRQQNTPEMQTRFINNQKSLGNWEKSSKRVGGRETWYDKIKNLYYTKDTTHYDMEVWSVSRKRAYHKGSIEVSNGQLYKGPSHAPQNVD